MIIEIDIKEDARIVGTTQQEAVEEATIEAVAHVAASALKIDVEELLVDLRVDGITLERHMKVKDYVRHGHHWHHQRVCVSLHFETETADNHFPAAAHWSRVHEWACDKFTVARDVCANLELRDGSAEGPALNEHHEIGHHHGCKQVWLVKPGPEPNGNRGRTSES